MTISSLSDRLFDDEDRGATDPFALFEEWFAAAKASEPNDPNAMALATVDESGLPDVRMVLMNGRDAQSIVFYTNFESSKGRQLLASGKAASVFHWKSLRRQVRFRGPVAVVSDEEADAYFATRARVSQIGANASAQSRPLPKKGELIAKVEELEAALGPDGKVSRPKHWSGFRLTPVQIEFWQDGAYRLHDRVVFTRDAGGNWVRQRLYP